MKITFGEQIKYPRVKIKNYSVAQQIFKNFINKKNTNISDAFTKNNDTLQLALNNLAELSFSQQDIEKIERYGATPVFKNGQEALELVKKNNIKIVFEKVSHSDAHAQWVNAQNKIIINNKYKNTKNLAEIYAISAAILHELAHAKDKDDISSIQEEINCLAMNALAFNIYRNKNPNLFKNQTAPIIKDGVALYTNLFFNDNKDPLIQRIKLKYGNLQYSSPNHPASKFLKKHF